MNFATTSIMPLLARLVIGAAMLTSGWVNCFSQIEIRDGIATELQSLNIEVNTVMGEEDGEVYSTDNARVQHTTRGVNRIVWLLHERWEGLGTWSTLIGWTVGVCQLLAGVLLIVGLFTRLAALSIVLASGSAVYLVAFHMHGMFLMNPFEWPLDTHRFLQLFAGLSICTLSLGLLCSGAGSLSIDRRFARTEVETTKNRSDS